jgi:5-methylcytosine-specific restriction endonuclease McrA
MTHKTCTRCQEIKPVEAFSKWNRQDGYQNYCKVCNSEYRKEYKTRPGKREEQQTRKQRWRQNNLEHARRLDRESKYREYERDPEHVKARTHNQNVKRRLRVENAFVEYVDTQAVWMRDQGMCQICGEGVSKWRRFPHPESPSVDHIVPLARGGEHSMANVQLTHLRCNLSKGCDTPERVNQCP